MRRAIFWLGWAILFILPVTFLIQAWILQDLPPIEIWKWAVPLAALLLIYLGRNRDDVFKHHLAH